MEEANKEKQLSSMKDYIKKRDNLKKYASAKKSEADIKVNISKQDQNFSWYKK